MKRNALAVIVVALAVSGAGAQIPFGPVEQALVARFDADKDGRLDAAERKAARTWLAANPGAGGDFFGGGRGFNNELLNNKLNSTFENKLKDPNKEFEIINAVSLRVIETKTNRGYINLAKNAAEALLKDIEVELNKY
jgi:hypothetical protein